jgi:hypothetical protein
MDWLTRAPGNSTMVVAGAGSDASCETFSQWCQPASWIRNADPAFIPEELYNLESTHDLVGKVRRHDRWGMRKAASKEPSTRSSRSGGYECAAEAENGFGFTSQNQGVIHACVRDGDTAVLPGAAKFFPGWGRSGGRNELLRDSKVRDHRGTGGSGW